MISFLDEAEKFIRANSVSYCGNEEIGVRIHQLMVDMGLKTVVQEVSHALDHVSRRQFNIIGTLGDPLVDTRTKKGFLLLSHVDTGNPGHKLYWDKTKNDPFQMLVSDERVFGLGAADSKLDFLCKLKALEKHRQRKPKMPIYIAATCGKELGMIGAKFLAKSLIVNPKYVLVGAPSRLRDVVTTKSSMTFLLSMRFSHFEKDARGFSTRIVVKAAGKIAPTSYSDSGDNAIKRVLSVLKRIREANFQVRVISVSGGEMISHVPDRAEAEFYLQSSSFDDFRKFHRENLSDPNIQIEYGGIGESGLRNIPVGVIDVVDTLESKFREEAKHLFDRTEGRYDVTRNSVALSRLECRDGQVNCYFDFHLFSDESQEETEGQIRGILEGISKGQSEVSFKFSKIRSTPAFISKEGDFTDICKGIRSGLGVSTERISLSTYSEASCFVQEGVETVVTGPGEALNNLGLPNESISAEELDKAVHFYDRVIERICL